MMRLHLSAGASGGANPEGVARSAWGDSPEVVAASNDLMGNSLASYFSQLFEKPPAEQNEKRYHFMMVISVMMVFTLCSQDDSIMNLYDLSFQKGEKEVQKVQEAVPEPRRRLPEVQEIADDE